MERATWTEEVSAVNIEQKILVSLSLPLAIDLWTCILNIRRALGIGRASGVPLLTLPIYWTLVIFGNDVWSLTKQLVVCSLTIPFHIGVIFGVPTLVEYFWLKRKR